MPEHASAPQLGPVPAVIEALGLSSACPAAPLCTDGVFYLDRAHEGGPLWVPSNTTLLPLPGSWPELVCLHPCSHLPDLMVCLEGASWHSAQKSSVEDEVWASYPGWWGTTEWRLPGPSLACLTHAGVLLLPLDPLGPLGHLSACPVWRVHTCTAAWAAAWAEPARV
jgi:hypothetical protein